MQSVAENTTNTHYISKTFITAIKWKSVPILQFCDKSLQHTEHMLRTFNFELTETVYLQTLYVQWIT